MISFSYTTDFLLPDESRYSQWINRIIASERKALVALDYIFCSDVYLSDLNREFLLKDEFTDILTFEYEGEEGLAGDIFISVDRVRENANAYGVEFGEELLRVMAHGVLHLQGYADKTEGELELMRQKEMEKMQLFHVEP